MLIDKGLTICKTLIVADLLALGVSAGMNYIQPAENSIALGINGTVHEGLLITNLAYGTENQQLPNIAGVSVLNKDYSQTLGFTLLLIVSAFLLSYILVNNIKKHERTISNERLNA